MTSAARKDFERLERFDKASKRFFFSASILMERVSVMPCAHLNTSWHNRSGGLAKTSLSKSSKVRDEQLELNRILKGIPPLDQADEIQRPVRFLVAHEPLPDAAGAQILR